MHKDHAYVIVWSDLIYTGCQVFPFFFPNWIDLISAVLIRWIWERRRFLPKLIVLINVLIALQFGKKKGKILHPVYILNFSWHINWCSQRSSFNTGMQVWYQNFQILRQRPCFYKKICRLCNWRLNYCWNVLFSAGGLFRIRIILSWRLHNFEHLYPSDWLLFIFKCFYCFFRK